MQSAGFAVFVYASTVRSHPWLSCPEWGFIWIASVSTGQYQDCRPTMTWNRPWLPLSNSYVLKIYHHFPICLVVLKEERAITEGFLRSTILRPWSDTSKMHEWGLCFGTPEVPTIFFRAWHRTAFPLWHRVSTEPRYPSKYLSRFTFGVLGSKSL